MRYENFRLEPLYDDEIPNSATAFDDSSDENSFVEKIVDDIVFVVAEEIVDENLLILFRSKYSLIYISCDLKIF